MKSSITQSQYLFMKTLAQLKFASILVMLLGTIHICATPFIFQPFNTQAKLDLASVYMFVMVGVSVIFIGWLQYYIIKSGNYSVVLLRILEASVLFMVISGIGAIITMWNNPFAYLSLIIGFYELVLLRYYSKYLNSFFEAHEKE